MRIRRGTVARASALRTAEAQKEVRDADDFGVSETYAQAES